MIKKNYSLFLLLILIAIGFIFRFRGLMTNYSFWTDEDHVAIFARAILERGKPILENGYTTGSYQLLWYWLTAFSMRIFGLNEFGARLPSLFFGILTIPAVYLVGKEFFDKKTGLLAAFFITFLKIEILWSRQARPYQAIQFFYLIEIFLFCLWLKNFEKNKMSWPFFVLLCLAIILSSLMHWFGLLAIIFFSVFLITFRFGVFKKIFNIFQKKKLKTFLLTIFSLSLTVFLLYKINFFIALQAFLKPSYEGLGFYNHWWYYHSFLWRQYGLISFLAFLGLIFALLKNWRKNTLILTVFFFVMFLINFRLGAHYVRYLYVIFPLIIILFSYALVQIELIWQQLIKNKKLYFLKNFFLLFLAIFLIINGYKFTFKPGKIYSINEDMQEVPEVDFKGLYNFVKEKNMDNDDWILINTWPDHATWYLGEGKPNFWLRQKESVKGKNYDVLSGALVISNLEDLKNIIKNNTRGLIILESWETLIPEGTKEFIKENLKKEADFDRIYPIQPRYWLVEVYSWGNLK
jgi:4-amino-4-deoxy-L-arabinose transferase-like glycosyltransferase